MKNKLVALITPLLCVLVSTASAQERSMPRSEDVHFFALLVGSNLPGDNQSPLRFAHQDMKKVGTVLAEIGKYDANRISQLADPSARTLKDALRRIKQQVAALPTGVQTRFVFYYSGHAKAHALTLGNDTLSLKVLRQLLVEIPSSQKIIILDACQSGSFATAKGVKVTEDFSHNSRQTLDTRGTAVLASSSADELSQESEEVKGSLFTHNLVTGLRGAADADTNGRVSLFEAYDYAYNSTLIASANTRIGKQHVTMETDLEGTGETVLTWPAASSAKLVLPKDVHGTVVVFDKQSNTISAEIHKAKGSDITLAFPPGKYGVIVTHNSKALNCDIQLKKNTITHVKKNSCQTTTLKSGAAKTDEKQKADGRWAPYLELQVGGQFLRKDAFIRRLEHLGFYTDEFIKELDGNEAVPYFEASAGVSINRYFALGILYSTLSRLEYKENIWPYQISSGERSYKWTSHRICFQARGRFPLLNDRFTPFVFLDLGAGTVHDDMYTFLEEVRNGWTSNQVFWGPVIGGGIGAEARIFGPISVTAQAKYIYAPIMANRYDEKHNSGGWIVSGGIRIGH